VEATPDTLGLLVVDCVMATSWQDRDGDAAEHLPDDADAVRVRRSGFAGRLVDWAAARLQMTVEIVRKPAEQHGFAVHPKRRVVERSLV
jgi:uncharacterized membrane protein